MQIAAAIRSARRGSRLSQRELARRAGVPHSTVARIETGRISPRASTVERLLGVLGYDFAIQPRAGQGVDRSLIQRMLALTPRQRIEYSVAGGETALRLQKATAAVNGL
ncbi:MAG: helix-turn-helix domain-containing protein [Actinomycetota bacterium]